MVLRPDALVETEITLLGGFSPDYDSATMHTLLAAFIDNNDIFGPTAVDGQDYFIYIGQRTDGYIALQEAFGEYRLGDTTKVIPFLGGGRKGDKKSPFFDTTSIRAGIQPFISDFRGFLFK